MRRAVLFGSRDWIDVQSGLTLYEAKRRLRQGIIYCGPRYRAVREAMIQRVQQWNGLVVIEGEADGADLLSRLVAHELAQSVDPYPVDHALDGPWPAAGPRRNERMHREGRPDEAIGFISGKVGSPMSRGSAGMVAICRRAGTPLTVYREDGIEVLR